jgi:hypothetical protein
MSYRVPVLENFVWQPSVKDRITAATLGGLTPAKGDRYLLTDGANDKNIAYCSNATGPVWTYDAPLEGMILWVDDEDKYYHYTGTVWQEYLGQQGIQGTKGDRGTLGSQGIQGTAGIQGTKGSKGDRGTLGSQGIQGTKGDRGTLGSQGIQGTKGSKGDQGTIGATGPQGPTGPGATYDISYGCLIIETS